MPISLVFFSSNGLVNLDLRNNFANFNPSPSAPNYRCSLRIRFQFSPVPHKPLSPPSSPYSRRLSWCNHLDDVFSTSENDFFGKRLGLSSSSLPISSHQLGHRLFGDLRRKIVFFLKKRKTYRKSRQNKSKHRAKSQEPSSSDKDNCLQKNNWSSFFFGSPANKVSWNIPWELFTIFQVMFLWFISFTIVGSYVMPSVLGFLKISHSSLSYRNQAIYSLITDICELFVGIGILNRCLSSFKPLPKDLFYFNIRGCWIFEILTAISAFPLVCILSKVNLFLLPVKMNFNSKVPIEQNLSLNDPIATLLYSVVVIICAPIWEEIIFRGFLLPSLTKYLPVSSSLVISSAFFAIAHFSVQRFLPLFFLGIVIGLVYLRSRNLFSSMLLHGLWNGYVFMQLLR